MSQRLHKTHSEEDAFKADLQSTLRYHKTRLPAVTLSLIGAFFIVGLIWSAFAKLDEVTVASGEVIPSTHIQAIQNLEGGIVEKIYVREGALVKQGQPLIRLQDTQFNAQYKQQRARYVALKAATIRLHAQATNLPTLDFPTDFIKAHPHLIQREIALFKANSNSHHEKLEMLNKKRKLAEKELNIIAPLVQQKLLSRLDLIKTKQQLNDIDARIIDEKAQYRKNALKKINEDKALLESLQESLIGLEDRLKRTTITSPIEGYVHNLKMNTIGGVVKPGITLLEIVPKTQRISVEALLKPSDIAFVKMGQAANIKFSAYDFTVYGGIDAKITHISPSTIENDEGQEFYKIRLDSTQKTFRNRQKPIRIIPGMTVTVDILTGKKTVLSYILKPFLKTTHTALRER